MTLDTHSLSTQRKRQEVSAYKKSVLHAQESSLGVQRPDSARNALVTDKRVVFAASYKPSSPSHQLFENRVPEQGRKPTNLVCVGLVSVGGSRSVDLV